MHLFYAPDLDVDSGSYTFSEEESSHCVRVLRFREGSVVGLTDGRGTMAVAAISETSPKKCTADIREHTKDYGQKPYYVHICIAPTKNTDRLEWFVEKAVEIGVDRITPVICDHSERKNIKLERLEKIAVSAMKQSQKAYLPVVDEVMAVRDIISEPFCGVKLIGHCEEDSSKLFIGNNLTADTPVRILIGPEGDFSAGEIAAAKAADYLPVSLGASRLRTETAGLYAAAAVSFINEIKSKR